MKRNYYTRHSNTYIDRNVDFNRYSRARALSQHHALLHRGCGIRREVAALLFVFIIALFASIIFVSSKAYADNSRHESVKMYKSIVIYPGDSLASIASDNYTDEFISMNRYIKEIASINNISTDVSLIPGNHIIVPYYESANVYHIIIDID